MKPALDRARDLQTNRLISTANKAQQKAASGTVRATVTGTNTLRTENGGTLQFSSYGQSGNRIGDRVLATVQKGSNKANVRKV